MSSNNCTYILKKGKNKGQLCGIKCVNNNLLCRKHSIDDINNNQDTLQNDNKEPNKSMESIEKKEKESKVKKEKESKEKKENKSKEKKEKESKVKKDNKEVCEKINIFEKQKFQAKRNEYNNYVLSNNLVVHPINKNIIGRQQENKIIELSIEDIEYCKEYGFRYLQPSIMYFSDSDVEKKEIELHKLMTESHKKEQNNDDCLEEDEDSESEDENNENNE